MPAGATVLTIETLNRMDRDAFCAALGGIVENSPWVALPAWEARPFPTVQDLHAAMRAAVTTAPFSERLALSRAHPDLAGRAARAGAMSAASVAEQASAGLDRLTDEEFTRSSD